MIPGVSLCDAIYGASHNRVDRVVDVLFIIIANGPDDITLIFIPVPEISTKIIRFCGPLVCIAIDIRIVKAVYSGYAQKNNDTMLLRQIKKPVNMCEVCLIWGGDIGVIRERITVHFMSP